MFFSNVRVFGLGLGLEAMSLGLEAVGLVLDLGLEPLSLESKPRKERAECPQ